MPERSEQRKKIEKIGFAIIIAGFLLSLIPSTRLGKAGKLGEYVLFGGAMIYVSGRFK